MQQFCGIKSLQVEWGSEGSVAVHSPFVCRNPLLKECPNMLEPKVQKQASIMKMQKPLLDISVQEGIKAGVIFLSVLL